MLPASHFCRQRSTPWTAKACLGAALLLLGACGSPSTQLSGSGRDARALLAERQDPEPAGRFRPAVVLPTPPLVTKADVGVPLSALTGRGAELEDVLLSLFAGSDLNILVGDDVRASMSFDVKADTMEGAFTSLLGHLDLSWRVQGDYVVVEPSERRVWSVDLPAVTDDDGTSALDSQARLWDELLGQVNDLLGSRGQAVARPAAGTLEVLAPPSLQDLAADQIDAFQQTLLHPVRMHAQLIEVALPAGSPSLDWSALAEALGQLPPPAGQPLPLGLLRTGDLLTALAAQGEVTARMPLRVTTRNGSPARLNLPDGRGGEVTVRLLPRASSDGSVDLSVEHPAGPQSMPRLEAARASLASGRALVLSGPSREQQSETQVSVLGGLFSRSEPLSETVQSLIVLSPAVSDAGLVMGSPAGHARPAEGLLERKPSPGSKAPTGTLSRAGLAAALFAQACTDLKTGALRRALHRFERATELDPQRTDALLHAAALHLRTGRPSEARQLSEQALTRAPDDVLALTLAGLSTLAEGRPGDAVNRLRRAWTQKPGAVTATNLAAGLIEAGDIAQAQLVLSEHHADEQVLYEPHLDRAWLHLLNSELAAARTELMQAATLGAPSADERMLVLQRMVAVLERSEGARPDELRNKRLPVELEDLVDPDRSPGHFLSGWH